MKTRYEVVKEVRGLYGPSEDVEHLIDWIQDAWETHDLLVKLFGSQDARDILTASSLNGASASFFWVGVYDDDPHEQRDEQMLN